MSYLDMDLLRFTTAGSVDDGKSTLIGRLLYDSKSIFEDQWEAIEDASKRRGEGYVNLALLTDGLKAEREQGITIDVAYRYFATPKRKFIIADTPGHIQYTRNMVTGASTANMALILVDARKGIVEQTRRHSFIASLLGIPHLVICINKMDLADYDESVFESIKKDYTEFAGKLSVKDIHFIPISALYGDNVVSRSENMPWYKGTTLMYLLENVHIAGDENLIDTRFSVQYVIRPMQQEFHDYRAYAGVVSGGVLRIGDEITVLPGGFSSKISSIEFAEKQLLEACPPMSVSIRLDDEIDISRGDMITRTANQPRVTQDIDIMCCWFNIKPLQLNTKYILRHTTRETKCIVKDIYYKVDINTMHRNLDDKSVGINDIAKIKLRTVQPLIIDSYSRNRHTGSIILIDEANNETIAAGMIL